MSFHRLLIYVICILYTNITSNCVNSQENASTEDETFPKQKCESLLVNCFCYDYLEITPAIVCNNKSDFTNFTYFLASGTIFDVNNTYEITFSGIKYLPARTLDGISVYRLILDDPELTIDESAFVGVKRLYRFHVRRSKIKKVPDFQIVNNSVTYINIDSSQLSSLEGKTLQNLHLVKKLSFVNNSIRFLEPDVFKGTNRVETLDLSYNLLTSLPPKLLDPMKYLRKFAVSHNNLIHVDNLFSVTHPNFIFLDFNNITDADSILHPGMSNVETFVLASNPIEKISDESFNRKIPNVRFIYLDHCKIQEFEASYYQNLSILSILDLSYNLIEEVVSQKIDLGKDLELDLIGNQIKVFYAEMTYKIKRLYLSDNKLQSLNTTLQLTQIAEVQIARNLIEYLIEDDLKGVHATANLELQGNRIGRIDSRTFVAIRNDLHYLDLSSNFIPSLNGSVKYLSQLKLLNLTGNLIQVFERGEFVGLNELSELYLEYNHIIALAELQQLPHLEFLVISHNSIETIRREHVPKSLRFMYLGENPIKCNCRLEPFLLWLNTSASPVTDVDLCMPSDAINTAQGKHRCPEICSCSCAADGNMYFISLDCSSKNLSVVPQFLRNKFIRTKDNTTITFDFQRSFVMEQTAYPSFRIKDRVLGIDLENNSLVSLDDAQIPPDIIHLYLSRNKLRQLPESVFNNLQDLRRISLSENPWDCDCKALEFKKWLFSNEKIVQDINNTRCGISDSGKSGLDGRVIWSLTDLDICPTDFGMIVSIAFGVLVFLSLCLTTKILYTKYELNIKVFLYSHGFTCVKEEDIDYDKEFDAFISFSHQDDIFVTKEIISVIENKDPNIRLCIHYRHFRPGEFIYDNIIYAVQNSKRTVLILSRNFLESEWCLMEFRAAHIQALEDKVHRIIVVKVGDLPREIDPSIKVYLDSTTYLNWGEKYFWNNLLYILPTSSHERNPLPPNVEMKPIA